MATVDTSGSTTPNGKRSFDVMNSPFGSEQATSFAYINSQLLAHGFIRDCLELDGLSDQSKEKLAECMFSMLQQRMDDLDARESLASRHRTLLHDHERMCGLYKREQEKVAEAERDVEAWKAKHGSALKDLKNESDAHRVTRDELQKSKSALQFVKVQAQSDQRRREKDMEKVMSRWQQMSDEHHKTSAQAGRIGLTLATPVNLSERTGPRQAASLLEQSLNDLSVERLRLAHENEALRNLMCDALERIDEVIKRTSEEDANGEDNGGREEMMMSLFPPLKRLSASFSSSPRGSPSLDHPAPRRIHETLNVLYARVESLISKDEPVENQAQREEEALQQMEQLKREIETLKEELESRKALEEETRKLMIDMASTSGLPSSRKSLIPRDSLDGAGAWHAEEVEELAKQRQQLEEERRQFTEAAIKLGKERAEVEAQRAALLEEKRAKGIGALLDESSHSRGPEKSSSSKVQFSAGPSDRQSSKNDMAPGPIRRSSRSQGSSSSAPLSDQPAQFSAVSPAPRQKRRTAAWGAEPAQPSPLSRILAPLEPEENGVISPPRVSRRSQAAGPRSLAAELDDALSQPQPKQALSRPSKIPSTKARGRSENDRATAGTGKENAHSAPPLEAGSPKRVKLEARALGEPSRKVSRQPPSSSSHPTRSLIGGRRTVKR